MSLKQNGESMQAEEAWQLSLSKKKRQKLKRKNVDYVDIYGPSARTEVEIKFHKINIKEAQELVFAMCADGIFPKWIAVKNRPLCKGFIWILAPGISHELYKRISKTDDNFLKFLGNPVMCTATSPKMRPGTLLDVLLIDRRHPNNKKVKRKTADPKWLNLFPPSHYKLKQDELISMDFPSLQDPLPQGYVKTGKGGDDKIRMFAVDCEMCITEKGLELTRITLLDEQGKTIIDSLVKPDTQIKDYLYNFSGITPQMMENTSTTLKDIQDQFLKIVFEQDLLVGHSLDNDLKAMKICHGNILDTCNLYPHPKGLPYRPALKVLTQKYLKREIQQGTHDSIQDAKAALDLVQLKIKHGPDWGTCKFWQDCGSTVSEALGKAGCSCVMVDRGSTLNKYSKGRCSAIPAENDDEAVSKFMAQIKDNKYKFSFIQLQELGRLQDKRSTALENRMKASIGILSDKLKQLVGTNSLQDITVQQHTNVAEISESNKFGEETTILEEDKEVAQTENNDALEAAKQELLKNLEQQIDPLQAVKQELFQVVQQKLEQLEQPQQMDVEQQDDFSEQINGYKKRKSDKGEAIKVQDDFTPQAVENPNLDQCIQNVSIKEDEKMQDWIADDSIVEQEHVKGLKKWDTDNFCDLQIQEAWKVHQRIQQIEQSAQSGTMVMVMTGHGNTGEVRRLLDMRNRCGKLQPLLRQSLEKLEELKFQNDDFKNQILNAPSWTQELEHELENAIQREIIGLCFCKIIE